jgi:hypothetical protein
MLYLRPTNLKLRFEVPAGGWDEVVDTDEQPEVADGGSGSGADGL